jgi:hypothetical protein
MNIKRITQALVVALTLNAVVPACAGTMRSWATVATRNLTRNQKIALIVSGVAALGAGCAYLVYKYKKKKKTKKSLTRGKQDRGNGRVSPQAKGFWSLITGG